MARIFTENFEGGTVGGTLQGFTAFNAEPATGAVFISSPVAVGARAAQITTPATAANRVLAYNLGALNSTLYSTVYIYLAANPAVEWYLGAVNAAGVARANWRINPAGTFTLRNANAAVWTSTATLPLNQWVRVEWRLDQVAGQQQMRVYSAHSSTVLFDSGNQTFTAGTFDTFQAGLTTAAANVSFNLDWVVLDNATWVGPGVLPTPTASFTRTPASGTAPLTVTFTNTSTDAVSYSWNFGDGTAADTATSPSHVYATPGTYTVTLTATNAQGSSTATSTVTVTGSPPTASFTPSVSSGTAPLAVTFTNTSTGSPTSYAWNFGDGTTSTAASPSKTYSAAGTYTVTMTATNANGTSAPASTTITVAAAGAGGPAGGGLATYVMTTAGTWQPITIWVWIP